jgi:murein DD-endopeptidase MepM/ murein hydrolase activator NlpD
MRKTLTAVIFIAIAFLSLRSDLTFLHTSQESPGPGESAVSGRACREITGNIKKGETFFDIFKKYNLDPTELFRLREASADIHRLKDVCPDRPYKIVLDDTDKITSLKYWIDDDTILSISSTDGGFSAEKVAVDYEKRLIYRAGKVQDNLISSLGAGRDDLMLALQLSDIFAWDIDFNTDLRNGDVFKIVVEGLYLDGEFKKYGDIVSAEFVNNGSDYRAYRFVNDGKADYYDEEGASVRRAFLKAPLSFRRISSRFTNGRYHPILKIYRPHHGLDYAAPTGTPVSASGDGTVIFTGRKGGYGNLVILRHGNGYKTYYGHLSRTAKGIRPGRKVEQGQVIAYVGMTGLATGPHLHYEMRINNRPVNPLSVKIPHGNTVPRSARAEFRQVRDAMDAKLAAMPADTYVATEGTQNGPHAKAAT